MSWPVVSYKKTGFLRLFIAPAVLLTVILCAGAQAGDLDLGRPILQPAALDYTGTFALRDIDPDLTGQGVTIAAVCRSFTYLQNIPLNDYRLNKQHQCFSDSSVGFVDGLGFEPGISEHSTAIGAILIGHDPNAYHPQLDGFQYAGAAPEAQLDVYEFWRFLVNHVFGPKPLKADILTMSVGSAFDDWWTRGINHIAGTRGLVVVASIGNGSDVFDPQLFPGAGANVIGVGVVDSLETGDLSRNLSEFSLPHAEHSSVGPTSDGRCKPDIVAPGNCIVPDANSTSRYDITGNWSSFAAPVVAGTGALLVQKAKSELSLSPAVAPQGGNCVMKAILMNSAQKLPYWHKGTADKTDDHYVSLDYTQGAGVLNAKHAYETLVAGPAKPLRVPAVGWDNNTLEINDSTENVYRIDVSGNPDEFITATLVWNRQYQDQYPFELLPQPADDMRLELWAVDTNDTEGGYMIDYSDSISDNVEHIHCRVDPNYTIYEVVVTYGDSAMTGGSDLSQRYGLAWDVAAPDNRDSDLWYDLNYDGKVDVLDFSTLLKNVNKPADSDAGYLLGDINMDGVIDINDVAMLMGRMAPES